MRHAILILILGLMPSSFASDDPPPIDRVEEDWELVIGSTDVPAAGPQLTTTMCPGPLEDHPDVNFNLNYRDGANFQAGGLQVEVFDGVDLVAAANSGSAQLQTDNETITWTQKLTIAGGTIQYQVQSGHSTTWGDFGGDDLTVSFGSALANLSEYSSEISLTKSGVGWQSDHVSSMRLIQVRFYSGDTLVKSEDTPRSVHPLPVDPPSGSTY